MKNLFFILAFMFSLSASAQDAKGPIEFLKRLFQKKEREVPSTKPSTTTAPSTTQAPKPNRPNRPNKPISPNSQISDLSVTMMPKNYIKRSEAVLNVALVYYGDYYEMEDLNRVQELLEERFFIATGETLKMRTLAKAILPFKHKIENYPMYRQPYVTDVERLQRLWYYDNKGANVLKEVWDEVKASPKKEVDLSKVDALLIVTGAQFDALGFASGRVAITENPMEIAWGLSDGGRVEYVTVARVVDELIHEVGHAMFLDHASNQCQKPGMTYQETQACCATSPAKDDVMSYCRNRAKVDDTFFYGFAACNRRTIKNKIIPALLTGGAWNIADREKCD